MTNEESLDERIINESKEEIFTRYHLYREFFGKLWWLNELLELVVSKCREEFEKESITPSYNQLLREQGAELEHQKIIGIIKQKINSLENPIIKCLRCGYEGKFTTFDYDNEAFEITCPVETCHSDIDMPPDSTKEIRVLQQLLEEISLSTEKENRGQTGSNPTLSQRFADANDRKTFCKASEIDKENSLDEIGN